MAANAIHRPQALLHPTRPAVAACAAGAAVHQRALRRTPAEPRTSHSGTARCGCVAVLLSQLAPRTEGPAEHGRVAFAHLVIVSGRAVLRAVAASSFHSFAIGDQA